jgi:hypothetical protein
MHRLPHWLETRCAAALQQGRAGLTFHFRPWWTEQALRIKVRGTLQLLVQHQFLLEQHLSLVPHSGFSRRIPDICQIRRLAHQWQIELSPLSDHHQRLAGEITRHVPELPEALRLGHARLLAQRVAHQDFIDPARHADNSAADAHGSKATRGGCRKLEWHVEGKHITPRWVTRDDAAIKVSD